MSSVEQIHVANSIQSIKSYLLDLQNRICFFLEKEDGSAKFREDQWVYPHGGGGITRILTGKVIEKAGVNFSYIHGVQLPLAATQKRSAMKDAPFQALGVSVVVHPFNPYAPTTHMNLRFILVENKAFPYWWFGGGFDLTPYYGFEEDCRHWHRSAKEACEPFGSEIYPQFKSWCDQYFFIKHRNEPRGIGGIFFDDLNEWKFSRCFDFIKQVGDCFIKAYQPILSRRKSTSFGEQERDFQLYRRGRYVEFNLLYDRGTLFGLQSGGRSESILMSLPPLVSWCYDRQPESEAEKKLYKDFLILREWD